MKKLLLSLLAFTLITTLALAAGTKNYGNFYFVDGDVGIGTTAPAYALDVVGSIQTDTAFYGDYWKSATNNSMAIQPTGDTDDFFSFKTPAHRPTIKREGGKFIYFDSSNVYDVGISLRADDTYSGTMNYEKDGHMMTVLGKNSPLGFKANSDYDDFIKIQTTSNVPEMTIVGAADLKINAGGANDLLLNHSGGNVGIGTTNPTYPLHVYGGSNTSKLESSTANTWNVFQTTSGKGEYGIHSDAFYFKAYSDLNGGIEFLISDANVVGLKIKADGNVGIGTDNPEKKLDIVGSADNTLLVASRMSNSDWATGETGQKVGFIFNLQKGITGLRPAAKLIAGKDDDYDTATNADAYLSFEVAQNDAFVERFRIASTGNVGIGTTSPDTKLDVAGAITQRELAADPTDPDEGAHVMWQSDGTGSGDDGDIYMKAQAGASIKTLQLYDFSANTWSGGGGGGDITDVFDCATGDCNTLTVGTSEYLVYGTGYIDANRFAGVTTVDGTEFGYLNGVSSAIQTQFSGKEGTLTNSAGLAAALSDESGTGTVAFTTSPTFVTPALGAATATTINTLTVGLGNNSVSTNTAVGVSALSSNTVGSHNSSVGYASLLSNTTGDYNSAIGDYSLVDNTEGNNNSAVGHYSLLSNITGSDNSAMGHYSLHANTAGNYNTAIGVESLRTATGSNNIGLGYAAGEYETGSNAFYVNNQNRTDTAGDKSKSILYGVMAAAVADQTLTVNAKLVTSANIELGHATDTTIARASAGEITVEGAAVLLSGGALGTPASGALTNCSFPTLNQNTTGSSASCTGNSATVTTNANLTGIVTSTGNATAIADKAIGVAKLADGTDGELITWSATGVAATVGVGTATHVLTSNGAGVAPTFQAAGGGGGSVGGLYGINVETLSADKTLTADTDKIYQYLDEGGATRIITLDTASATAGDRFVIRHNGVYDDTNYLEVKQSTTQLDKIYVGTIKEFIFDGTNWVSGENGSGENDSKQYNLAIGHSANAYSGGIAIGHSAYSRDWGVGVGRSANANNYGVAIGRDSSGWSNGVGVGASSDGGTSGVAIGRNADGYSYGTALGYDTDTNQKRYSTALGYYSETERTGEVAMNIGADSDQENNRTIGSWAGDTANATPTEIFAGGYGTERFTIRASSVLAFRLIVTARDNVAGHVGMWTVANGVIKRDASNNTAMATAATVVEVVDESTDWTITVTADDTNEALIITVTGDGTNAVQWAARLDGVETHF